MVGEKFFRKAVVHNLSLIHFAVSLGPPAAARTSWVVFLGGRAFAQVHVSEATRIPGFVCGVLPGLCCESGLQLMSLLFLLFALRF